MIHGKGKEENISLFPILKLSFLIECNGNQCPLTFQGFIWIYVRRIEPQQNSFIYDLTSGNCQLWWFEKVDVGVQRVGYLYFMKQKTKSWRSHSSVLKCRWWCQNSFSTPVKFPSLGLIKPFIYKIGLTLVLRIPLVHTKTNKPQTRTTH